LILLQEHELEDDNHQLKCRVDQLDGHLAERQTQMNRSESVIEQLTTELNNCQDDLNKSLDKVGVLERIITDFKEQVTILEHDVSSNDISFHS
jgi:chromosome segregation ATPase